RLHPAGRRAHVQQLRRRAEGRRRGRQQEGLRPAQLPQGRRDRHGRARRRGVRGPAVGRPVAGRLMTHSQNLLGEPPATLLPANEEADRELAEGIPAAEVAAHHPTSSAAWAALAEAAIDSPERQLDDVVRAYAYARTGYHRGLDAL